MYIDTLSTDDKSLFLGTAMWGWAVEKQDAFRLLDHYVESGYKLIDQATNYPINGNKSECGLSLKWLSEWLHANPNSGLEVLVKVGSVNNAGTPDNDLSVTALQRQYGQLHQLLKESLKCVSIHWDNREVDKKKDILTSLDTLTDLAENKGYRIGISGIKSSGIYADYFTEKRIKPIIQVKENALTSAARINYQQHFAQADYIAYGINLGGLQEKITSETQVKRGIKNPKWISEIFKSILTENILDPSPQNFYDISLYLAFINPDLSGMIIGPKNIEQLSKIFRFFEQLKNTEYLTTYDEIKNIITRSGSSK